LAPIGTNVEIIEDSFNFLMSHALMQNGIKHPSIENVMNKEITRNLVGRCIDNHLVRDVEGNFEHKDM
jgi:hypothetical protein